MNRLIKKIFIMFFCFAFMAGTLTGVMAETNLSDVYASGCSYVILSRYSQSMDIGSQFFLSAVTSNGGKATYSSSKSSVASVDKYGLVKAKASGKATITVKCGGIRAYCFITVNATKITLSSNSITLLKGQIAKLRVKVSSGSRAKYSSSKSSVAKVDATGNITAVKNGTAVITVKADGEAVKCMVTVRKPNITLDKYDFSLKAGQSIVLSPKVSNGYRPQYSSSNSKAVKVAQNGKLTAVKKGKATVTISEDGTKIKCQVNVQ